MACLEKRSNVREPLNADEIRSLIQRVYGREREEAEMILSGETTYALGKRLGYTHERARQRIHELGLYENWLQVVRPITARQRRKTRQPLINVLSQRLSQLSEQLSPSEARALKEAKEYVSRKACQISLEKAYTLFSAFFELSSSCNGHTFSAVMNRTGYSCGDCGYILRKAGLIPEETKRRQRISAEQKEVIFQSPLNGRDIKYFTGYYPGTRDWQDRPNVRRVIHRENESSHRIDLNYRKLSEVYEATDVGFSVEETVQLTGLTRDLVDYAVANRERLEQPIIDFLRGFYGNPEHNVPYKTRDLRKPKVEK
jgi:hypothetical protein